MYGGQGRYMRHYINSHKYVFKKFQVLLSIFPFLLFLFDLAPVHVYNAFPAKKKTLTEKH